MAGILPRIISREQSAFVRGCDIADNILLVQELVTYMGYPKSGENIAIKLDMVKVYDRVDWNFLNRVLRAFGFSELWIDILWRAISNCWFTQVVNGMASGYFKAHRGVRQGDLCLHTYSLSQRRCSVEA